MSEIEYESKLKQLIKSEVQAILNEHNEEIVGRHKEMMDLIVKLGEGQVSIKKELEPVIKVYSQATGFSSVMSLLFKAIVIPISVMAGIWFSVKNAK